MRFVKYLIVILIFLITSSIYFGAISDYLSEGNLFSIFNVIPITLLDFLLYWIYSRKQAFFEANSQQRSHWLVITALSLIIFLLSLYAFILKIEADKQRSIADENIISKRSE